MRNRNAVIFLLLSLTSVLIIAFSMPGCNILALQSNKPEKIVVYHFGDLSGIYASATAPIIAGFDDFAAWFNQNSDGIDSVPIVQKYIDTKGDIQAALKAYETIKISKPSPFVCLLYGSDESIRLQREFVQDGIFCFTSAPLGIYPAGNEFSTIPTYSDSMGAFMDWVSQIWSKRTGQPVSLAILTWDNDYGNSIRTEEVRKYAAQKNISLVYEDVFKVADNDISPQLQKIKDTGANWIYDNTLGNGPIIISSAASKMGILSNDIFNTSEGKIHRATGPWGMDDLSVILAGELVEGMVGPRSIASWSMSEAEGVVHASEAFLKNNRKPEQHVIGYLGAWPVLYTICDTVRNVVDEKGWGNLNGHSMREQFLKLRDYRPLGMTSYSFTAERPAPDMTLIFKIERGRLLPLTDWVKCPDLRPATINR